MLSALPSLLLGVPQCRDGWMTYTENGATKCVTTTYESHGIAMQYDYCPAVCASLARTWLDALDPVPKPICVGSSAEVEWWHANSPRASYWAGLYRDGPKQGEDWEGAPWGPAGSPAHVDDQCIASASSFYEQTFAVEAGGGATSDVWGPSEPNHGPWTQDQETGKENCILAINRVAAGGDDPGGGPGWCARPAGPSAAPARPPRRPPPRCAPPRRAALLPA